MDLHVEPGFDVTHDLSVVSKTTKGVAKKTSATPMSVGSIGAISLGRGTDGRANEATYYALSASREDNVPATTAAGCATRWIWDPVSPLAHLEPTRRSTMATALCGPTTTTWLAGFPKPDNCFRITVDHGLTRNYLDAYTVELDPNGADVAWGKVAWEAWEDLTCAPMEFSTMDQVDVCAMFEAEVAALPMPTVVPVVMSDAEVLLASNIPADTTTLEGFNLSFKGAADSRHRFTAMWYARKKANGKAEMPPPNLYATDATDDDIPAHDERHTANVVSGYDATAWVATLDDDNDPIYGDLGKVTIDGQDTADNFNMDDDSYKCSADDGGAKATGTATDPDRDANSTLCDASDVEIATSVTFPLGLGYGCDPVKVEYTLTCDWSSRGNAAGSVNFTPIHIDDEAASATADGAIQKFVSCKVS